jgi:ferric-dicitrate binding protein FerR (iron transport regulator)
VSKWLCALTLAGFCAACGGSTTDQSATGATTEEGTSTSTAAEKEEKPALPEYREVTIPAGTTLRLNLQSAVSSDGSQVEDTVRATLRQAVTVDGQTVLPSGTELVGTVTDAERSGRVKGRARVAYRFNSLRYDSERYPITTAQISHQAQATKRKDATKIGVGAGVGAAVGALLGGGSGAAKGAAIGGAAGTGAVLATRGDEVRLGPGADVNTRLTAPLVVRVKT